MTHDETKDGNNKDKDLSTSVHQLKKDAKTLSQDGKTLLNDGVDCARALACDVKKSGLQAMAGTKDCIKNKPVQSVAIALAAGLLAGALCGYKRAS